MRKVIIVPGNGCSSIKHSNWYGWLHNELSKINNIDSICENFPDPIHARRENWLPFINSFDNGEKDSESNTILVGHSSGAQASLRYAETHNLRGVILVSATYSDLGDAHERASNYYPSEDGLSNLYDFEAMRRNCKYWKQFHSDNDPFIPLREAEQIRDGLGLKESEYCVLPRRSHFFDYPFPEVLQAVLDII